MTTNRKLVTAAKLYLEMRGFTIQEMYWHLGTRSIDIIASKQERLWFIKVIGEKSQIVGAEHAYLTVTEQKALARAAEAWIDNNKSSLNYSIASIEIEESSKAVLNFNEGIA